MPRVRKLLAPKLWNRPGASSCATLPAGKSGRRIHSQGNRSESHQLWQNQVARTPRHETSCKTRNTRPHSFNRRQLEQKPPPTTRPVRRRQKSPRARRVPSPHTPLAKGGGAPPQRRAPRGGGHRRGLRAGSSLVPSSNASYLPVPCRRRSAKITEHKRVSCSLVHGSTVA